MAKQTLPGTCWGSVCSVKTLSTVILGVKYRAGMDLWPPLPETLLWGWEDGITG